MTRLFEAIGSIAPYAWVIAGLMGFAMSVKHLLDILRARKHNRAVARIDVIASIGYAVISGLVAPVALDTFDSASHMAYDEVLVGAALSLVVFYGLICLFTKHWLETIIMVATGTIFVNLICALKLDQYNALIIQMNKLGPKTGAAGYQYFGLYAAGWYDQVLRTSTPAAIAAIVLILVAVFAGIRGFIRDRRDRPRLPQARTSRLMPVGGHEGRDDDTVADGRPATYDHKPAVRLSTGDGPSERLTTPRPGAYPPVRDTEGEG